MLGRNGSRWWRFKYRFDGREKLLSFGEFNLDAAEWRIPGERIKMREQHIVPLSRQAVELLRELQAISRRSEFLFPTLGNLRRPMSENTLLAVSATSRGSSSVLSLQYQNPYSVLSERGRAVKIGEGSAA